MDELPGGEARAVAFASVGSVVLAVGRADQPNRTGKLSTAWTVRRSLDNGMTWTTVDADTSKQDKSLAGSRAEDIAIDGSGTLYVAGAAAALEKSKTVNYWVVRRSTDGGSTWSVVDKYRLADGSALTPTGIAVGPEGVVWVCGHMGPADGSSPNRWLVRNGTPGVRGSIAWEVSDDFQLATGQSARANDVTSDAFGNVFVTGWAADASGVTHWITRKLAAP